MYDTQKEAYIPTFAIAMAFLHIHVIFTSLASSQPWILPAAHVVHTFHYISTCTRSKNHTPRLPRIPPLHQKPSIPSPRARKKPKKNKVLNSHAHVVIGTLTSPLGFFPRPKLPPLAPCFINVPCRQWRPIPAWLRPQHPPTVPRPVADGGHGWHLLGGGKRAKDIHVLDTIVFIALWS